MWKVNCRENTVRKTETQKYLFMIYIGRLFRFRNQIGLHLAADEYSVVLHWSTIKYKVFPPRLCVRRNTYIICCVLWSDTQVPHAHVCKCVCAESLNRRCWCWVRKAVSVWPPCPLIRHTLMFLLLPLSLRHFKTRRLSSTLSWS